MASILHLLIFFFYLTPQLSTAHPNNGSLLPNGNITLHIVWYGVFPSPKRAVILDFLQSLSSHPLPPPSVSSWWNTPFKKPTILLGDQIFRPQNGGGNTLKNHDLRAAAAMAAASPESLTAVLTAEDVTVEGFCVNRCGTRGWREGRKGRRVGYVWVGNSEKQCPGYCAWPFYRPVYGPQGPPLVAPNGDVGVDGMVINLARVMAGAVGRIYGGGGEGARACEGVFGEGAYPGYGGEVEVDEVSGGSYNGRGVNGRRFLLPAMWDPFTSACVTKW